MAFFNLEKRENEKDHRKGNSCVGPGQYEHDFPARHRRQVSYAPFGSLASKHNSRSQEAYLGPGQYNIASSIAKPCITKYENKNIIIVKINDEGGHQFKSRSNRFQDIESSPVGPGSYYREDSHPGKKRARSTSLYRPKVAEKVRFINQQYYEQRQPTLLSDPFLTQEAKEKGEVPQAKGVLNWSLSKKERFDPLAKQHFNEQDKRKALSQFSETKKRKTKPSAVFLSKSIKSHFETQIYKTNNSFKAELRKMIDYKDEDPGPGTYEPARISSNKILQKFQFFGSTVERFPLKEDALVGPGSYELERKTSARQLRQNISFSEERDSYLPKSAIPGPGAYLLETNFIRSSYSQKQVETAFGSQKPRFPTEKEPEEKPETDTSFGTSHLKQREAKRERELKLLKKISEDHPSAIFSSKTNRFTNQPQSQIEIGTYDVTQNDINSRMAKQQKLIKQLEECQLHKPPFLSSDERFKEIKIHENEHRNCWCQVKSVEKQMIEHESPVFISNDRRTAVFEQPFKAPPVGYYQGAQKNMIKDSFNSRFKKKNENRIKKDLALRPKNQSHPDSKATQIGRYDSKMELQL